MASTHTSDVARKTPTPAAGRLGMPRSPDSDDMRRERLERLGLLTAGLAHEINNLLTPVVSYAELARARPGDAAMTAKALERAADGAARAADVARLLLAFARGNMDQSATTTVNESLDTALTLAGLERSGIDVSTTIEEGLSAKIGTVALQQVLMNLLINAARAVGGPGRVTVGAGRVECSTGNWIRITVSDDGRGIEPENLERIFEPFVSGSGGTGLGLMVSRMLVEAVGGRIDVESRPGAGATFTIDLPAAH